MADKQCSKCGIVFNCYADGSGCWCQGYTIPTSNLERLKTDYQDCLCPKCLSTYQKLQPTTIDKE